MIPPNNNLLVILSVRDVCDITSHCFQPVSVMQSDSVLRDKVCYCSVVNKVEDGIECSVSSWEEREKADVRQTDKKTVGV